MAHPHQHFSRRLGGFLMLLFLLLLLLLSLSCVCADATTNDNTDEKDAQVPLPIPAHRETDPFTAEPIDALPDTHVAIEGGMAEAPPDQDEDEDDGAFLTALLDALLQQSDTTKGGSDEEMEDNVADDVVLTVEMEVGLNEDDDVDPDDAETVDAETGVRQPKQKPSWSMLKPAPLSWGQFVTQLHDARCLQMPSWWMRGAQKSATDEGHHGEEEDDEATRTVQHLARFSPDSFCLRPVVLLSTWLQDRPDALSSDARPHRGSRPTDAAGHAAEEEEEREEELRCASCEFLRNTLLRKTGAELSFLFPSYATLVLIDDPMQPALLNTPHLHLLPDLGTPHGRERRQDDVQRLRALVETTCVDMADEQPSHPQSDPHRAARARAAARFRRECVEKVLARVLHRVGSLSASPFVLGANSAEALVSAATWHTWEHDAFEAQGSYAVRALFLYPHNGSVMRHVVNDDVINGDSTHVHFYLSAEAFMRSVRKAIWTMRQLAIRGRLYE